MATVLEGQWRESYLCKDVERKDLEEFCWDLFSMESMRMPEGSLDKAEEDAEPKWAVMEPISVMEVTDALRGMGDSAAGVDKIETKVLLQWHQPSLVGYRNLVLAVEELPRALTTVRVVFLPKTDNPVQPGDY